MDQSSDACSSSLSSTTSMNEDNESSIKLIFLLIKPSTTMSAQFFALESVCYNGDGSIASGTLKSLIEKLFPAKDRVPSADYVFAFLLNVRLFCDLPDILHEFIKFFIFERNAKTENFRKENRLECSFNILKFLSQWCDDFPTDFYSDHMKKRLKELLDLCCTIDRDLLSYRSNLINNLQEKLDKLDRELIELETMIDATISRTEIDHVPRASYDLLDNGASPRHLAEQLTIIEQEHMNAVSPEEFVYIFDLTGDYQAKIESKNSHAGRVRMAKNIQNYVSWCNRLNNFVAFEICKVKNGTKVHDLKKRTKSAMNMNAVKRLYKAWSRVDTSKLKVLEKSMDPKKNFVNYRSTLQAAVWRSSQSKSPSSDTKNPQVIIPAFCVLCRDLYVTQNYCKQMMSNGHLNFQAFTEFAQIVKLFSKWKNLRQNFVKDDKLYKFVMTTSIVDERRQNSHIQTINIHRHCEDVINDPLKLRTQLNLSSWQSLRLNFKVNAPWKIIWPVYMALYKTWTRTGEGQEILDRSFRIAQLGIRSFANSINWESFTCESFNWEFAH
uniref:Uncharacterized protein n=1 Tax=Romanomermis culicivorax TaxID=13658 RepID=A0A915L257_ROMCU